MAANDFRYALRTLSHNPGFTATALLTIALGIGASTAIFSVVNAVLLKSLPYTEPERLVLLWGDLRNRNVRDFPTAPGDYNDIRAAGTQFEGLAAVSTFRQTLTSEGAPPEQIWGGQVTTNFLSLLGLRVIKGRDFVPDDGTPQPPPPTTQNTGQPGTAQPSAAQPPPPPPLPRNVILAHGFWKRRYGGDSSIVGKSIRLGNGTAQVIGVLQPGAELLWPPKANIERVPDLWDAMRVNFDSGSRINVFLRVIGRLKPGATLAGAQAQMDQLSSDLRQRFPIKQSSGFALRLEPMQQNLVAAVRPALLALMGAVLFVLLIACANVANLLLVRAAQRDRELVVRVALGGSQWDLVRQMMSESVVLAGSGAALGLLLSLVGIRLLKVLGPRDLPRLDTVGIDLTVLAFTMGAAVVSALIFGIVPAIRASRPDAAEVLRTSGRSAGLRAGRRLRNTVVVAEVALSFVLLIGSGLMFRSFLAVGRTDPGFDSNGVLTFQLQNPRLRGLDEARAFWGQVTDRLKAIPGVTAVTTSSSLPLDGQDPNLRYGTQEALADANRYRQGQSFFVQPNYFETMRTRLISGRTFTEADRPTPPPQTGGRAIAPGAPVDSGPQFRGSIIVDEWLAAKVFPGQQAVGKRLLARTGAPTPDWFEIIGVVQHQRHTTLTSDERESLFFPVPIPGGGRWVVRASGDPEQLGTTVRTVLTQLNPNLSIADLQPMRVFVDRAIAPTRFALVLIGIFGVVAAILSAVGLYGVLSSVVRSRIAEIGVRVAFGAPRGKIFQLVIGQGLRLSAIGIAVGLLGSLWLTQGMSRMLVGVKPIDPVTFSAMVVVFSAIAAAASWLPARRAAALEPTVALRED
jgi:putative ABC transport system permease protein